MKKALLFFFLVFSLFSVNGQITETFESATKDAQSFTAGGATFNLSSPYTYFVYGNQPGLGYNGSDRFIHVLDPQPTSNPPVNPYGQTGTLKIASGSFKLNSFWLFLSGDPGTRPNVTRDGLPGSATIKGKLAGITQFTIAKPVTGANIGYGFPGNGFEFIDLATAGGTNNTNVNIDELEITLSDHLDYFAIDDFRITTSTSGVALSTSPTLTFTNGTGLNTKATDGAGGSTAISDLNLEIFGGNKTTGAILSAPMEWHNASWFSSINGFTGVTPMSASVQDDGFDALIIKSSAQANNFALKSFGIIDWGGESPVMIAAYDGGTLLGSVELTLPNDGTGIVVNQVSALTGIFNNVDEVRIYSKSGNPIWVGVNNINVGPAVVDLTPPTVTSMERAHPNPTSLTDLVFSIFFSENVNGVDINDFDLVKGPGVSATLQSISAPLPNGQYNISVSNVSGSGTLGLNLKASGTGIADLVGNPISSGFTGPVYTIDQTAPAAPVVITPVNGSVINSLRPAISGTAEANARINIVIDGSTLIHVATADASGNWSYVPTTNLSQGSHTVSARAVDLAGNSSSLSNTNTFTVSLAPTIVVNPGNVTAVTVGVPYSQTFTASGGVAPHTFSLSNGTLPQGLTLNSTTGALTGTPTAAGGFNFTIKATDGSSAPGPYSGTQNYSGVVAQPVIVVAPTTISNATVATAYSQTITASGGITPYTYSVTGGSLPAGLTINNTTGIISGTPTAGGTFNFTVTARSYSTGIGAPHTSSRAYELVVNAPTLTLNPASMPSATAYVSYSQILTASGGTAPYTYAITLGSLPDGLTLSTGGVLSGTPTASGTFNFTVTGTDSSTGTGPYSKSQEYTLNIISPIVINPASLPDMIYGVSYNESLTSSGGVAPYSYSLASGGLPNGITFSPEGVLSGTPRSSGSFPLIVRSTDANGVNISRTYNFMIQPAVMAIIPSTLLNPVLAVPYSRTLTSSGGIAPYSYSVTSGSLPNGLLLSSAGVLSGTPTSAGTFTFIVKSADNGSASTSQSYTLTIATPTLTISPASLPGVTVGDSYSQTLTTTGATAPYTYVRTTGTLPLGLSLSTGGVISGIPTTKGTYSFTVRSTDSSVGSGPYSTTKDYSIVVQGKTQTLTMASTKTVNYGDADFDPMASSNSPLTITYTTSNPAIATIVNGKVHIVGAGLVTIFANQAGNGTYEDAVQKQQALTINKAQLTYVANAASRIYGAANPAFSGTVTGFKYTDNLAGSTTGTASFTTTATTASPVGSYAINGSGLTAANYTFVQAATNATRLSITPKELTITADNQEKFAGAAIPPFTASYSGFANGETQTVVTTKPVLSTTATAASPVGTYDINASGAVAANYTFKYVKGVLTIKPGAPTDISLAAVTLYENRPSGTNAGTLSSVSPDPSATFTFTLVSGAGDTDNSLFSISANKLNTAASLNFEQKANYSVRIRSTTQYGLTFDKTLNVTIADVNEIPTLDAISNLPICYTTNQQTVPLTGISAGPESGQTVVVSVTSTNSALFESLNVSNSGTTGSVNYRVKTGAAGTATVTVTVKDNGGTANGGVDTYSQTFVVTVNPLPILAINSDKGTTVSRGEVLLLTATGASNYVWTGNNGIVNGANSAVLQIRPTVTTTYTLTGTNSSGCSETQTFTVTVLDDLAKIKATNILTPNNDGYNDKWVIDNIDVYPNNDVKVFDKAGRIVYTKKGYDNSWDGQMNGTALNEGTYYYVIDFGQGKRKIRGYITVIRNN
ncbi:putative Ig domain-containing protein [Pedobacter sp. ASV1-7]|uniref:putative Ig domain-containing protein n=1 Tax=Pedobacter sp. ASV1-7 TaxID=3145237 RepID=UPI0032E8E608